MKAVDINAKIIGLAHPTEGKKGKGWYQRIELKKGIWTPGVGLGNTWEVMKSDFLPDTLKRKKILDIGCNAGYHMIEAARMGAMTVGIEPDEYYYAQAEFVKSCLPKRLGKRMVFYKEWTTPNFLKSLGNFDMIWSINVLHNLEYKLQAPCILAMADITDEVIARYRNKSANKATKESIDKYFRDVGFRVKSRYPTGRKEGAYRYIHYVK